MKREWTKALPRVIDLDGTATGGGLSVSEADIFKIYATWLYKRQIPVKISDGGKTSEGRAWELLTRAYLLGERLLDTTFKDIVMDGMLARVNENEGGTLSYPTKKAIKAMYEGTCEGSLGRQFFAEVTADYASKSSFARGKDVYPAEFLFDFGKILLGKRAGESRDFTFQDQPSRYHERKDAPELGQSTRAGLSSSVTRREGWAAVVTAYQGPGTNVQEAVD